MADQIATVTELEQQLKKLRRRQKRNQRAAWADGFLTGICGMLRPGDLAIDCGANAGEVSARLLASGADVIALLSGTVRPRMVAALDACKTAGFRLGCITNNAQVGHGAGMSTNESRAAQMADAMARFEHVIESSKSGIRKPDPRIYLMMCAALDVAPDACVYLDDLGINCKPAAALGMTAIKVNGEHQALDDLGRVLGMNFD